MDRTAISAALLSAFGGGKYLSKGNYRKAKEPKTDNDYESIDEAETKRLKRASRNLRNNLK